MENHLKTNFPVLKHVYFPHKARNIIFSVFRFFGVNFLADLPPPPPKKRQLNPPVQFIVGHRRLKAIFIKLYKLTGHRTMVPRSFVARHNSILRP